MKKIFIILLVLIALSLILFAGCLRKAPPPSVSKPSEAELPESEPETSDLPESSEPEEEQNKMESPDGAAEILLESINKLDKDNITGLVGQYFGEQAIPEEYFSLLQPISERLTYKIGDYEETGENKAAVNITVTAVDAQSAINSVMPRAVAHLAAMQLTGKDVSSPEKILAEYAAENIKWDDIPTVKTDSTLYLVKGADGEWKVDASNPDNISFANAISGGAVDVANNLKSFADRYK